MAQWAMLQQQGGGSTLWKEWWESHLSTAAQPMADLRRLSNSYTCKSHFIARKLSKIRTDTEESEVPSQAVPGQDAAESTRQCLRPFPYHPLLDPKLLHPMAFSSNGDSMQKTWETRDEHWILKTVLRLSSTTKPYPGLNSTILNLGQPA